MWFPIFDPSLLEEVINLGFINEGVEEYDEEEDEQEEIGEEGIE